MSIMNKTQKGVILAIAFLMLFSSVPGFAQADRFKDVNKSHWAYDYIEHAAELDYIKGTSKDKFSPDGILTFEQAIVLLGRFTNPTSEEERQANIQYNSFLNELDMSQWVKEDAKVMTDIAVAMYKDVVSKAEMENVYKNKRGNRAITKLATSVYLVRSMGLAQEAENKNMVSLTYRDALEMSTIEMKYLSVLIEADVLDPKGSGAGLFEPKSSLRRDVMAKMMSTAHVYLEKNPDKPKEPSKPEDKDETENLSGVVVNPLSVVGNKNFVIIDDGRGNKDAYEVLNKTSISLDGKSVTQSSLNEGQEIDLVIKKGTLEIISIKAFTVDKDISGTIASINSSSSKLTLEYTVDKKTVSTEYPVGKNAYIYLDGKIAEFKDLSKGDLVDVKIKSGVIEDIEAKSKSQIVEGIIKDLVEVKDSKGKEYNITIVDSKDKSYQFLIDEKTIIYKDNRKVSDPKDLKVKDEVYIKAEYGVAIEIDSNVVRKRIEGLIVGKSDKFGERTEITILNKETKKEEKYIFAETPYIRIDRMVTNASDLKLGYSVNLLIEGDEILELEADSRASEATIIGIVSDINPRVREMVISIESFNLDSDKYGDKITVYIKDNPVIVDRLFEPIDISRIRRGDRVNVIGSYDGNSMIADTIQIR